MLSVFSSTPGPLRSSTRPADTMGKKKKGKKGKKGKKEEVVVPSLYTGWELPDMKTELEKLEVKLAQKRLERNYVQLERDTIQQFYDISKKEARDVDLAVTAKDQKMEMMTANHRVEVRVYIQKVKHLEYEHKNSMRNVRTDGETALEEEKAQHFEREKTMKVDKKSLRMQVIEAELSNEEYIIDWKDKHDKKMQKLREEFQATLGDTDNKYVHKCEKLRRDLELRRKVEIHEIEERKNLHINDLMSNHENAFKQIKE